MGLQDGGRGVSADEGVKGGRREVSGGLQPLRRTGRGVGCVREGGRRHMSTALAPADGLSLQTACMALAVGLSHSQHHTKNGFCYIEDNILNLIRSQEQTVTLSLRCGEQLLVT